MGKGSPDGAARLSISGLKKINIQFVAMVLALAAIWAVFSLGTGGSFLTARNISDLFQQMAETGVLAVGMTMVIIAGEIDLSVGSLAGLCGGIAAILQVWRGAGTAAAVGGALAAGVLLGLWQGWWVARRKVPSFIVTLGGLLVFRGVLLGITNGETVAPLHADFVAIGQNYLSPWWGLLLAVLGVAAYAFLQVRDISVRKSYRLESPSGLLVTARVVVLAVVLGGFTVLLNSYLGVPVPILIVALLALVFTFVSLRTRFGRGIFAIGGNRDAARLSGLPIARYILLVFALNGLMAALSGVIMTARVNAATIDAGTNYELNAIAACVIGGTSLMGGIGSIYSSLIGALIMASLDNGMSMMNLQPYWQYVIKGLILILAVWFDVVSKNARAMSRS